jgi:hypothetical protein
MQSALESEVIDDIRRNLNQSRAYATDRFKDQVEAALRRRIRPGKGGWPKKPMDRAAEQLEISV